nr:hypothetical protein Hi04_10k_c5981_00040 [uncultured bacterium]
MVDATKKASVELQLLLACLRYPPTDSDRERIRSLVRGPLNVAAFLRLVEHHQVAALVFRNLDNAARSVAPEELLPALRLTAQNVGKKSFQRVMETIRLVSELQCAGIEVRVLKGIALAIHAYRDATLQDSIDIDLLVPVGQLLDAESVLARCGYRRIDPFVRLTPRRRRWLLNHAHHIGFSRAKSHEKVELHWGLTPNLFKHQGFELESLPKTSLSIGSYQIPSLTPEDMFLHACVHGADHYWNRLKWLAQVAAMIEVMTPQEFTAVQARATKRGVLAEVSAAVALAEHFNLSSHRTINLLGATALTSNRIVEGSIAAIEGGSLKRTAIVEFRDAWLAASSYSYRRNLVERTIIRNENWELIDLPDSMFFLYVLLAPLAVMKRRRRVHLRRTTPATELDLKSLGSIARRFKSPSQSDI